MTSTDAIALLEFRDYIASVEIPQISSASVSFLASMVMLVSIASTEKRLTTPFRRIIFGLSVADVLQSFALIIGPFMMPSDLDYSWGIGSDQTCQTAGFLLNVGAMNAPRYTFFLCFYYLCKLKYRMTNECFSARFEWKLHGLFILFSLATAIWCVALNLFKPMYSRSFCQIGYVPPGCQYFPEVVGECENNAKPKGADMVENVMFIFMLACFLGVIVCMVMLLWHARQFSNTAAQHASAAVVKESREEGDTGAEPRAEAETGVETENENDHPQALDATVKEEGGEGEGGSDIIVQHQQNLRHIAEVYRSETVLQAVLYVVTFVVTFAAPTVTFLASKKVGTIPKSIQYSRAILYPIGGLFNILVFTRPAVTALRRADPSLSRFTCLWMVIKAGGELPARPSRARSRRLRNETISTIQFGVANDIDPSETENRDAVVGVGDESEKKHMGSMEAIDGLSLSYGASDAHNIYNPESQWSYVKGGTSSQNVDEIVSDSEAMMSIDAGVSGKLDSDLSISQNEKCEEDRL